MVVAGRIILRKNKVEEAETPSGIILPESMTTEENVGTVLHVGAKTSKMDPEVIPGDMVVFNHKTHRLQTFELEGEDVVKIGFEDIYLIHKPLN